MRKTEIQRSFEVIRREIRENPAKAKKMIDELKHQGQIEKNLETIAYGNYCMAELLHYSYKREEMLEYSAKALVGFRKVENYLMQCRCYNIIGISYDNIGEGQTALDYFLRALEMVEQHKLKVRKNPFYNNIGLIYADMGDYQNAYQYFSKVYKKAVRGKDIIIDELFSAGCNMADMLFQMGNYEEMEQILNEMEEKGIIRTQLDHLSLVAMRAKRCYAQKFIEEGNRFFDLLMRYSQEGIYSFELFSDYEAIADLLLELEDKNRSKQIIDLLEELAEKDGYVAECLKSLNLKLRYHQLYGDEEALVADYREYFQLFEQRCEEEDKGQTQIVKQQIKLQKSMDKYRKQADRAEEIKLLSQRDSLTGLLNRQSLNQLLENSFQESRQKGINLGCLFLDLDCFKEYNDTYGHVAGDACLQKVAEICRGHERENCHFARYGGDEFLGLILGESNQQMEALAEDIRSEVEKLKISHEHSKVSPVVTVSVGYINRRLDEDSNIIDLVNFSDKALYRAKQSGKNQVQYFQQDVMEG